MKKTLHILAFALPFLSIVQAQNRTDREAVKSLCGCFEVTYEYAETFARDTTYHALTRPYRVSAFEYVVLEEETPDKMVLQHLLIVDDTTVIKHWRQDWVYEPTTLFTFEGKDEWLVTKPKPASMRGQWAQKVYEVDDSPRYTGVSDWVLSDGKKVWENTADAPLPRREYTKRSDYQILRRTNRNIITDWGWIHDQDNEKVVVTDKDRHTLVEEKGRNTYRRSAPANCALATSWWQNNRAFWRNVRAAWDELLLPNYTYTITKQVDGRYMGQEFSALAEKKYGTDLEARAAVRQVIKKHLQQSLQQTN